MESHRFRLKIRGLKGNESNVEIQAKLTALEVGRGTGAAVSAATASHSHQKTPTGAGRSGGAGPALACGPEDEARVARSPTDAETLPIFSTGLVGL